MSDDHGRKELDPEIVRTVLTTIDEGQEPSLETLSRRFPGRREEIEATLQAVDSYQEGVRKARSARIAEASSDVLRRGTTLGDFTIEAVLGRGAMGVVYRARQKSLGNREVALKVLPAPLVARDPRFVDRFRREAALASRVHHPNVAEVYGFGPEEGRLFFAMRLVEGRTLDAVLSGLALRRRLGDARHVRRHYLHRAVRVVRDVAGALAAIHARNLVHRDVKPANIVLESAGADDHEALAARPVLVDFGLLRPVGPSDITGTQTLLGTPAFAAPESQLGREVDARADVFSLGAILHDLLTLTRPGERGPAAAGLSGVRALNPAVDGRLAAIVEMALQERPALRYASGAELERDLDRYLRDEPVRARPTTPVGRVRLWARRNPMRAVKAGAVGFVLLGLLVAGALIGSRVVGLYTAASRAARLEREGDMTGAARVAEPLFRAAKFARLLPGLKGAVDRAESVFSRKNGRLARVCALLAAGTEPEYATAHDILHGLLLTPGHEDARNLILRFLVREVREGEAPWRRRLAVETSAHYLLIHPASFGAARIPGTWQGELESALRAIAGRGAGDTAGSPLRHVAVSALSGLPGVRVFKALLPLIGDPDPELCRLALTATDRMWWQLHGEQRLFEIPQALWAAWVRVLWENAPKAGQIAAKEVSAWIQEMTFVSLFDAAWTRLALDDAGRLEPWPGLPGEAARLLASIERAFADCRKGLDPPPLRSSEPWADSVLKRTKPRDMYEERRAGRSSYRFENIWDASVRSTPEPFRGEHPVAGALAARFDFSGVKPRLEGAAMEASLRKGVAIDTEKEEDVKDPAAAHFLEFRRPGQGELRLRSAVPPGAVTARVTILHCHALRSPLPGGGRARVRVTIGTGEYTVEQDVPLDCDPLALEVHRWALASGRTLDVTVRLVAASTTYRVYSVQIEFSTHAKDDGSPATPPARPRPRTGR